MSAVIERGRDGVRLMNQDDLDAIMGIEVRAYSFPWTRGIFRDCLHVGYCCRVYEIDSEVRGYCVMSVGAGEAHILNLCVHPEYQKRGIGRAMLLHLVDLARTHRADDLLLEVRPSNIAAMKLYFAEGFDQVGIRHAYYPAEEGSREDAVIMARSLKF